MTTTGSVRGDILLSIKQRLLTCTEAAGYPITIHNVLGVDQKIDMGMDLPEEQLPSVIVIDEEESPQPTFDTRDAQWSIRLQLIHKDCSDVELMAAAAAVVRVLMAGDPVAEVRAGWRSMHPRIISLKLGAISGDLGMIQANRLYTLQIVVGHRLKAWEF